MKIHLDPSKHCIETEIKRHYNRSLSEYFQAGKNKGLSEKIIELTQQALKSFDFAKLRSKYPPLCGNTNHNIILSMNNNKLSIAIDGIPIKPIRKDSV